MGAIAAMERVADELRSAGVATVLPSIDDWPMDVTAEQAAALKRRASLMHMRLITSPATTAVLIVNVDRYEQHDYIGPNTFAEIAVAVSRRRKVFLLQGVPLHYEEELAAWGVTPLYGDLRALRVHRPPETAQLALFDIAS